MANGFSPQIYSEGAVEFDSTPTTQLYSQILNRQQAKSEALDEYYRSQFKNVNPAGMRAQDIPVFTNKVNEWQKFYQQNREKIRNPRLDGGQAATEFNARMQDAMAAVQQSKSEQKKYEDIVPILRDPDKRSRLPEAFMGQLAEHEKPINDPTRKSLDIASLNYDAKPFDVAMQQKFLQGVQQGLKMDEQVTGVVTDPKTYTRKVTTTSSFGPEAKSAIQARSAGAYQSDPSFKSFIDQLANDWQAVDKYNKLYRQTFGKDISSPEDLGAAWSLNSIQDNAEKQKIEADWKAQQDYLHSKRLDLLNRRLAAEKAGEKAKEGWVNEHVNLLKEQALMGGKFQYKYRDGRVEEEYDIPMDAVIAKSLRRGSGERAIEPDYLRYNPKTGKFRPVFGEYETVEITNSQGNKEKISRLKKNPSGGFKVDEELSKPISEAQLVLALGGQVTPTQRTVEMKKALNVGEEEDDEQIKDQLRKKYDY